MMEIYGGTNYFQPNDLDEARYAYYRHRSQSSFDYEFAIHRAQASP